MVRLIIILLSIIVAASFTINAYWLNLNGHSTIDIINRLPVLFAPSNYVFMMWVIVYVFLLFWVLKCYKLQKINAVITSAQSILFVIVILMQIISILSWHYEQFVASVILQGIQFVTLFILYRTFSLKNKFIQLRSPIAAYLSWTLFLLILSCCYVLVHIQWNGFGLSNALWCVLAMTVGTAIVMHLRYHYYDITSPIILIWCYIGISISNGFDELLVVTAALFLSGVMFVGILFMKKNPVSSN